MNNKEKGKLIKDLMVESLEDAYNAQLKKSSLKSAKFVECFGNNLYREFCENELDSSEPKLAVQKVKDDGSGKQSGEWLLDIVIKKEFEIADPDKKQSKANLVKDVLWAIESESSTSIKEMAKDFGKLVVINAENYVYLNGVDQKTIENVNAYIKRRIETVEDIMDKIGERFIGKNLYYGFWPKPGSSNWSENYWDNLSIKDLKSRIKLFELSEEEMKLEEI
ncbi:hypothetical protein MWH28_12320 [Natroniella sulfidigena]|uniref:hypothetical protein n=1 Tax=Natroniella sulfidigena TaxID=723921 RepID=UPI00200A3D87|nr:hypothetical protein [Natroniella sulfidigena]MCK8818142.1 hypothetical protein [Natroniella sulfidigena]